MTCVREIKVMGSPTTVDIKKLCMISSPRRIGLSVLIRL